MYAEIRNDFYNDAEGKVFIDAWKTDDDNEEGSVIAKVDILTKEIEYLDPAAKADPYAQELIADVIKAIEDGVYDADIEERKAKLEQPK